MGERVGGSPVHAYIVWCVYLAVDAMAFCTASNRHIIKLGERITCYRLTSFNSIIFYGVDYIEEIYAENRNANNAIAAARHHQHY